MIPEAAVGKSFGTAGPGSGVSAEVEVPIVRTRKPVVTVVEHRHDPRTNQVIPDAAEPVSHWIVNRDTGWGCDGCDWTGKLDDFWKTHGRPENDNLPF